MWTPSGRHLDVAQGDPISDEDVVVRVAGISGACLFVTRETHAVVVARTGEFFDEDFIAYREDAELGFRAALVGVPSYVVTGARGLHVRANRGTARGQSHEIDRLGVRNRFLLAFKYGRCRPGNRLARLVRDAIVVGGVLVRERSSASGLRDAWRLRHRMRRKGAMVLEQAVVSSRAATYPGP